MGKKLREILAEAKKNGNGNGKKNGKKNGKMLKKLHELDDRIEEFIDGLEDEIINVEDNPMFVKKASQLLADMSKEYSEFIVALRAIVNAVDRKEKVLAAFDKTESRVRDMLDGAGKNGPPPNEPPPDEEEDLPPEEGDDGGDDEYELKVAKKGGKKSAVKEALERVTEGKFQRGFWVVLYGKGGELDRAFVKNKRGIKAVLMDWSSTLDDGDTIKIEKGESEF